MIDISLFWDMLIRSLMPILRFSGFFAVAPLFSTQVIPTRIKILIILIFSMLITMNIKINVPDNPIVFVFSSVFEVLIGIFMGFIFYLFLWILEFAGGFFDMQSGMGMAAFYDPQMGSETSVYGNFFTLLGLLIFLIGNFHYILLKIFVESYYVLPVGQFIKSGPSYNLLMSVLIWTMTAGLEMALPVVLILFLIDLSLGIMARTAPQLNVLLLGLPLKILITSVVIIIFLGFAVPFINQCFNYMNNVSMGLINALR
ncbi:MAG: flagellar biosynthetic protein FliR [Thermodesulfobium narugense]|nr:MAG: flagellar biosynthetic protein FliR [Thermodesulfobium narugense]